jgi:hypothetical protein
MGLTPLHASSLVASVLFARAFKKYTENTFNLIYPFCFDFIPFLIYVLVKVMDFNSQLTLY